MEDGARGYLRYFTKNMFENAVNQILNNHIFVRNGAWNAQKKKKMKRNGFTGTILRASGSRSCQRTCKSNYHRC